MKTQGKNIISFDLFVGLFYKKILDTYLSKPYRKALDEIRSV